jgi:hypothetical protein
MNLKTKKALASGALAISLGALALGVAGISPAIAEGESGAPADPIVLNGEAPGTPGTSSSTSTSTSTETLDWCGWYLSGVDGELSLEPDTVTKYAGEAIELSAEDAGLSVFVGGTSTHSEATDNCSWYGVDNKQEISVTVTASGYEFDGEVDGGSGDESMDFILDSGNPLNIDVTADTTCTSGGFGIDDQASIYSPDTLISKPVTSNSQSAVTTVDKCDWSVDYVTSIPGGLIPLYGGVIYDFVGPTLTTTLSIE